MNTKAGTHAMLQKGISSACYLHSVHIIFCSNWSDLVISLHNSYGLCQHSKVHNFISLLALLAIDSKIRYCARFKSDRVPIGRIRQTSVNYWRASPLCVALIPSAAVVLVLLEQDATLQKELAMLMHMQASNKGSSRKSPRPRSPTTDQLLTC